MVNSVENDRREALVAGVSACFLNEWHSAAGCSPE